MTQEVYYKAVLHFKKPFSIYENINSLYKSFSNLKIYNIKEKSFEVEITTEYNAYYSRGKIINFLYGEILSATDFDKLELLSLKEEAEIYGNS